MRKLVLCCLFVAASAIPLTAQQDPCLAKADTICANGDLTGEAADRARASCIDVCRARRNRRALRDDAARGRNQALEKINEEAVSLLKIGGTTNLREAARLLRVGLDLARRDRELCRATVLSNLGTVLTWDPERRNPGAIPSYTQAIERFTEALAILERAPSDPPQTPTVRLIEFRPDSGVHRCYRPDIDKGDIHFYRGRAYVLNGQTAEAEADYDRAVAFQPHPPEVTELLDRIVTTHLAKPNYDEAIRVARRLHAASSDDPAKRVRARTLEGQAQVLSGRNAEAITAFEGALAEDLSRGVGNAILHRMLGEAYLQGQSPRIAAAVEQFRTAVSMLTPLPGEEGELALARFGLAAAQVGQAVASKSAPDLDAALAELEQLRQTFIDNPRLVASIDRLVASIDDHLAYGYFIRASRLADVAARRRAYLQAGDKYAALNPKDVESAAKSYVLAEEYDKVIAFLDANMPASTDPKYIKLLEQRGFAHHLASHVNEAIRDLSEVARHEPGTVDSQRKIRAILARNHLDRKDWRAAIEESNAAIAGGFTPADQEIEITIRHNAGVAYANAKMFPEAIVEFDRVKDLETDPAKSLKVLKTLGDLHAHMMNDDKSVSFYRQAFQAGSRKPHELIRLGIDDFCAGRFRESGEMFELAAKASVESEHLNAARVGIAHGHYMIGRNTDSSTELDTADGMYEKLDTPENAGMRPSVRAMRAHTAYMQKRWPDAIALYRAELLVADDPLVRRLLGEAERLQKGGLRGIRPLTPKELMPECK